MQHRCKDHAIGEDYDTEHGDGYADAHVVHGGVHEGSAGDGNGDGHERRERATAEEFGRLLLGWAFPYNQCIWYT